MRALTLHEPWASLIAEGVKNIETRSWAPPEYMLGRRIIIHAGKKVDALAASAMDRIGVSIHPGHIVATAVLVGWMHVKEHVERRDLESPHRVTADYVTGSVMLMAGHSDWRITDGRLQTDQWGDFSVGRYMWLLASVQQITPPVPVKGAQGLWDYRGGGMLEHTIQRLKGEEQK